MIPCGFSHSPAVTLAEKFDKALHYSYFCMQILMRPVIIQTCLMPGSRYVAITLFGMIFTRNRSLLTDTLVNHEMIHCRQQLELLYLPFFIIYVMEWLYYIIRFRNWDRAYRSISFEREAYANGHDLHYLESRPCFANFRYFFTKRG